MPETGSANDWPRVPFGDVVRLSRERSSDPGADGFQRYVGLDHMEPGELRLRRWGDISEGTTFTGIFRVGQVLFGKRRAYQRKVAVADFDGVCSGDIYVLEAKQDRLVPELLPFICQTEGFFQHAVGTSAGSLSPRTNWESLASYELVLPPLEDQRRVAHALVTVENALIAALTVATAAESVRDSLSVSLRGRNARCPVRSIASLLSISRPGLWGHEAGVDEVDVRVLTSPDLDSQGRLKDSGGAVRSVPSRRVDDLALRPGDIFLEKSGGGPDQPVGRVGFVESPFTAELPTICGNFIQMLRADTDRVRAEWLYWLFFGFHRIGWTLRHQTQTTGIRNLQVKDYLSDEVPIPLLQDQERQALEIRLAESARRRNLQRHVEIATLKKILLQVLSTGAP